MEVLKLKGITHNGKLTVAVPDAFNNKEVEVIVPLLKCRKGKVFMLHKLMKKMRGLKGC